MDPITLSFYGTVCSCLSVAAPKFSGLPILLGNGASVGIIVATTQPYNKDILHAY